MSRSSTEHEARAAALRVVEDVAEREVEHERVGRALREERDDAVREARALGVPIRDLQDALGVSRSAVNRVLGTGS